MEISRRYDLASAIFASDPTTKMSVREEQVVDPRDRVVLGDKVMMMAELVVEVKVDVVEGTWVVAVMSARSDWELADHPSLQHPPRCPYHSHSHSRPLHSLRPRLLRSKARPAFSAPETS